MERGTLPLGYPDANSGSLIASAAAAFAGAARMGWQRVSGKFPPKRGAVEEETTEPAAER